VHCYNCCHIKDADCFVKYRGYLFIC
jgi:hypothetical protein